MTGPIPPELGRLTKLQWLALSHNELSGSIPPELGSLPNLQALGLAGNGLSGCVPAGFESVRYSDVSLLELPDCS